MAESRRRLVPRAAKPMGCLLCGQATIVIIDNLPTDKRAEVRQIIEAAGATLRYSIRPRCHLAVLDPTRPRITMSTRLRLGPFA